MPYEEYIPNTEKIDCLGEEMAKIIKGMLNVDPKKRLTV